LGAFPASDPLDIGMPGMHGTYEANMAMHDCDVMFNVGARFDDRVTGKTSAFAPHARKIHIDIDPSSINKNCMPIVGDARMLNGRLWRTSHQATEAMSMCGTDRQVAGGRLGVE
jgi:acetolactate synthase-1/2/3 large subunit